MNNSFVRANTISGLVSPIASLFLNVATVVIIYVGALRVQSNPSLKAGDILATIQYIALIANAVLVLSWTISFVPHIKVSMKRISAILDIKDVEADNSVCQVLKGDISFDDVSFAYPGSANNALSNISLNIAEGEIVGIIGGTGSGKTTLVKLLLDFYSSAQGIRTFGGKNYCELTPAIVRDNVSVALQKSMIFEGTVADNVKMGQQGRYRRTGSGSPENCADDGFRRRQRRRLKLQADSIWKQRFRRTKAAYQYSARYYQARIRVRIRRQFFCARLSYGSQSSQGAKQISCGQNADYRYPTFGDGYAL